MDSRHYRSISRPAPPQRGKPVPFTLRVLVPDKNPEGITVEMQLRKVLKLLLRGFGIRCTAVRDEQPDDAKARGGQHDSPPLNPREEAA